MKKFDVLNTNLAIDKLLETTKNPRHRDILIAYAGHRVLEVAGYYQEVTASKMMVDVPVYHLHALGLNTIIREKETVVNLYRMFAETNQGIFYPENEQIAVGDDFVVSVLTLYQQVWLGSLILTKTLSMLPLGIAYKLLKIILKKRWVANENAMYLRKSYVETIWQYDDQCRLIGEHVWEPSLEKAEIIKLDAKDVLKTADAAKILAPLTKPYL